jgi:hypothetical protein
MTGRPPTETSVLGNRTAFRTAHPEWISLPQLFKENGCTSLRTGKIFHGAGLDDPNYASVRAELSVLTRSYAARLEKV